MIETKIGIISLGCSKNRIDTENMLAVIQKAGYPIVSNINEADLVIINTCAFIKSAKEEAIETILTTASLKEAGSLKKLIVTGCFSQRYKDELADEMPEVDGWIGVNQYGIIDRVIKRVMNGERVSEFAEIARADNDRLLTTSPHYAYVRIAEGCDLNCSYCAIPQIRGPYRSRLMEDIVAECISLVRSGVKELILVAQDTSGYGRDLYGKPMLVDLLEKLSAVQPAWIRCLYLYPERITDELLDIMQALPNVLPYLDMPLQHVEDDVLFRMKRPMTKDKVRALIDRIRSREVKRRFSIRTTLLVGFPGETGEQAQALADFVAEGHFDHAGAFTYSREENTLAYGMPNQIPEREKKKRLASVMNAQQAVSLSNNRDRIGKVYPVIVDLYDEEHDVAIARGDWMAPEVDGAIRVSGADQSDVGSIIRCRITDCSIYDLTGEKV